jgi:hypothetical protein
VYDPANLSRIWLLRRKGFVVSDIQVQRSAESNQAAPEERRKKKAGAPFWLGMRYISMRDG